MEMKLDASQETIIDQQQTIEKFRELVRGMQGEMGELRANGGEEALGGAHSSGPGHDEPPDTAQVIGHEGDFQGEAVSQ